MKDFTKQKRMGEIELNLNKFLNNKPLFYKRIDYDRMPNCWERIKNKFQMPKKIIHIIGTNGKGSTGRFLSYYLYKLGFKVGHYSSPHILKFNERIWINGKDISDKKLEEAHSFLQKILSKKEIETLSYFEYTTLLAMKSFENLDYVILEAGLGGEKDATAVFDKVMTLVTTIDFDHQNFLGDTIEEIAITKLNAIQKKAIIGKQIHNEVYQLSGKYPFYIDYFDNYEIKKIRDFINKNNFASYLADNLALALAFIVEENLKFDLKYLKGIELNGRLQQIEKNVYIDVGHNPLAAKAILKEFQNKKIDLIYNTYNDKNYKEILTILKPIINKLSIIEIQNDRIAPIDKVIKTAEELQIAVEKFEINKWKNSKKEKPQLIFGSFSVVEKFLNEK